MSFKDMTVLKNYVPQTSHAHEEVLSSVSILAHDVLEAVDIDILPDIEEAWKHERQRCRLDICAFCRLHDEIHDDENRLFFNSSPAFFQNHHLLLARYWHRVVTVAGESVELPCDAEKLFKRHPEDATWDPKLEQPSLYGRSRRIAKTYRHAIE